MAQRIIDVAHGDPTMGNFVIGSPLAWATTLKGAAGMFLGRHGWRHDLEEGIAMARSFDPTTHPFAQLYKYAAAVQNGGVLPTAQDVAQTAESLEIAQRSGDTAALAYALVNRATALIHCNDESAGEGFEYLAKAREMLVDEKLIVAIRRMTDAEIARGRARSGDLDGAIDLVSRILNAQFDAGTMMFRAPATTVLVETLLARAGPGDAEAAQRAVDRLEAVPTESGFVLHEIPVLRLRALLARVRGDEAGYRQLLQRFRARAYDVGFEGYVALADAMAAD